MGGTSTDYSSNYAPKIDQSHKLTIKTGIQSGDVPSIMNTADRILAGGVDGKRRELEALREENRDIRKDMKDFVMDDKRNHLTKDRDNDDYSLRNKELNLRSRDTELRYSHDSAKMS